MLPISATSRRSRAPVGTHPRLRTTIPCAPTLWGFRRPDWRRGPPRAGLSALRQFHGFLVREDVRADDPTAAIEPPRLPRTLPKYLSEAEVDALLAATHARPGPQGQAARAALETLYATGLRVSELLALPRTALSGDAAILMIRGKGGRDRIVPLSDAAREAARIMVEARRRPGRGLQA